MRLIFTLSTGRCGTKFLAKALNSTIPGVTAAHEPDPNFVNAWKLPLDERRRWLHNVKLPALPKDGVAYAETSHLVNLGFIEPLLDLGVAFDVIWLQRDLLEVALSYYRAEAIPARTAVGKNYCPAPDHPDSILGYSRKKYEGWPDFTMCYWHAKEKHTRNALYAAFVRESGRCVATITTAALADWASFMALTDTLGLPQADPVAFEIAAAKKENTTDPTKLGLYPPQKMTITYQESLLGG